MATKFLLRKCDLNLMREAIALGDRLKAMPEASPKIVHDIERLQEVLRRLPEATPNVCSSYGFDVLNLEPEFAGVNRGWGVEYQSGTSGATIGVTSNFVIVPDRDEHFERAREHLHFFHVATRPIEAPKHYAEWIEEVQVPDRWRNPDQEFEIDADFRVGKADNGPALPLRVTQDADGFSIALADRAPVRIELRPWRFVVSSETDQSCEIVPCDGEQLADDVVYALRESPNGKALNANTDRRIREVVGVQRRRLLRRVPREVLAIQHAVPREARRGRNLAMEPLLYAEPLVVKDVQRYRAAVIALAYCREVPGRDRPPSWWNAAREVNCAEGLKPGWKLRAAGRELAPYITAMRKWRSLFAPSSRTYPSLDRTLARLPQAIPAELVLYLRAVHLPRAIINRVELLALLSILKAVNDYEIDSAARRKSLTRIALNASEAEIRAAVSRLSHHLRMQLNPANDNDMRIVAAYLLDWPGTDNRSLSELVTNVIAWLKGQVPPRRVVELLGLSATRRTVPPPIPVPPDPGIRFLSTVEEIVEEGERMQHGVAFNADGAVYGKVFIFHVDYAGEEATVEITDHAIVTQACGPRTSMNAAVRWGQQQIAVWARGLAPYRHSKPSEFELEIAAMRVGKRLRPFELREWPRLKRTRECSLA